MVLGTRRRVLLTAVAVLLAAVVAVAAVRAAADELSLPRHRLGPGGSELPGSPDAPVLVEVYADFACPGCARFHRQAGPLLDELVGQGRVRVAFHHRAVLSPMSGQGGGDDLRRRRRGVLALPRPPVRLART
jgi:protein-disulfide isomerase